MPMTQSLARARLSMLLVGVLLSACGDDTSSNEQAQTADAGDSTATQGARGGTSGAARGGRGGNAANNTASAGRSAGQTASAGQSASAGRSAGRAGAAANSGAGTGGVNAPVPDAGTTLPPSDLDAGPSQVDLTDGQIAAILSAVNSAETSAGTFALTRAITPAVRSFAQSMVEMHATAQDRQAAIFATLNLTLTSSTLSTQLTNESTTTMTQLMALTGTEFEAAYLRSQVNAHTEVLMLLDEQLLPSVVADTLRAELVLTRTQVASHVDAARVALTSLEADTDAGAP